MAIRFMLVALFSLISCLPASFASALLPRSTYPSPVALTGNLSYVHDPAVIKRTDGTYFRLSTSGNIAIASAPALVGPWTYLGAMLPEGSSIYVSDNQELWAPDVMLIDDVYHVFYSVSFSGYQNSSIGLATSTTLEPGSFTDHGAVSIPEDSRWNKIDPNIFQATSDGPYYFAFGSAWDGIFQTELSSSSDFIDQVTGVSPTQKAYNSTLYTDSTENSITEGGYQFWVANATGDGTHYYYLFYSSGQCCQPADDLAAPGDEYKIMVCRSDSPSGTFVDDQGRNCATDNGGTLVLASHGTTYAPGGQGVLRNDDGRAVMYYHYVNTGIGYAFEDFIFGWNYLDFSSGWPVVVSS